MIDKATVEKIKDTADIVEVVSDYVHLIRRGANYVGLCPFHNERTPSFSVNRARNYCYCFSCHKGGSPVNFIMEKEGISYHDALLQLAKKYGIKVEERELTDEERLAQTRKEGLFVANEWAMKYFENNLHSTQDGHDIGLQYLYGRGVTPEAITQFHLGYAIDNSTDFLNAALRKGFNIDVLKSLGLVGTSQKGHDYDRFRGRVIFPILNSSGKVIAFGGRDLKGAGAKYINSPESELYKKSNELYGMYQARNAIVKEDRCFLVEGYLDVIGMWQAGMQNVVASSGTALTDGQIALIHRFTKNITLIYDGDSAGIKASMRGIDMLLAHQLDVKVLLLPDGDDPDSFARKHTPEEFQEYIRKNEVDFIRFKTHILIADASDDPQKRVEAIRSVVESLAAIPDKVKRDIYVQECSRLLGVNEETVAAAAAKARGEVVEQLKKQRRISQLSRDIETGRIPPVSQPDKTDRQSPSPEISASQPKPSAPHLIQTASPLAPLEWTVLKYCIRYGFIDFCEAFGDEEEKVFLNVIEYVNEELKDDGITFSVDDYAFTFNTLKELLPEFKNSLIEFHGSLQTQKEKKREEGFEEIGRRGLSMLEIEREEQHLEEQLSKWESHEITEFAKAYPSRVMASHENDTIRRLTTEALRERHQLSNIYSREHRAEQEEDKLFSLIPTAITVWKNGILDQKLKKLLSDFREIAGKGNHDEERKIQAQLAEVIRMRSEIAKNIGDRIICPSNIKRL